MIEARNHSEGQPAASLDSTLDLRTLRRMGLACEQSSLADPERPGKARDGKS